MTARTRKRSRHRCLHVPPTSHVPDSVLHFRTSAVVSCILSLVATPTQGLAPVVPISQLQTHHAAPLPSRNLNDIGTVLSSPPPARPLASSPPRIAPRPWPGCTARQRRVGLNPTGRAHLLSLQAFPDWTEMLTQSKWNDHFKLNGNHTHSNGGGDHDKAAGIEGNATNYGGIGENENDEIVPGLEVVYVPMEPKTVDGMHVDTHASQIRHEEKIDGSYSLSGFASRKNHASTKSIEGTKLSQPPVAPTIQESDEATRLFQPSFATSDVPISKASYSRLIETDAPYFNTSLPKKKTTTKSRNWIGAWDKWREPIGRLGPLIETNATEKRSNISGKQSEESTRRRSKDSASAKGTVTQWAKGRKPKEGEATPTLSLPVGRDPETPLTLSDLDTILRANDYVRKSDLRASRERPMDKVGGDLGASTSAKTKGGVAFPQPSVLSYDYVRRGATLLSAILGFVLASSVTRNLWMVGVAFGAVYGQSVSSDLSNPDLELGPVGEFVTKYGRKVAQWYLEVWDFAQGMWFMYRTGQLSYDYWKRYESLDQRFKIQDKMDAWNARFVEGKKNFDSWEQDNEIGRKVLAGLRTVWMVEETSYRKQLKMRTDGESEYRVVRYARNVIAWVQRLAIALWRTVTGRGDKGGLGEFLKGIRVQVTELNLEIVAQRAGSAVTLLVLINAIGALFATAPGILSFVAITAGILWPDWVAEAYFRMQKSVDEIRARGRGEATNALPSSEASSARQQKADAGNNAQARFHYFVRKDGSRRYYRTGIPLFKKLEEKDKEGGISEFFANIKPPFMNKKEEVTNNNGKRTKKTRQGRTTKTEGNGRFFASINPFKKRSRSKQG